MPEYLSPGVYVMEVASGVKPIEGVSTNINEILGPCIEHWRKLMENHYPDLATESEADHAILLLQFVAWAAESLAQRTERLPERGRLPASRLATAALALLAADHEEPCGVVARFARFGGGSVNKT